MGGGRSTKKNSRKGKLNEKNSCTPINPKKYSCNGLKNSYKEFDNEKKFLLLENSPLPPPITFLMVRPLPPMLGQLPLVIATSSIAISPVYDDPAIPSKITYKQNTNVENGKSLNSWGESNKMDRCERKPK